MKIIVNGAERELAGGTTLRGLLDDLGAPDTGFAVARNDEVVRRAALAYVPIEEGDRIEIIKAVSGG